MLDLITLRYLNSAEPPGRSFVPLKGYLYSLPASRLQHGWAVQAANYAPINQHLVDGKSTPNKLSELAESVMHQQVKCLHKACAAG